MIDKVIVKNFKPHEDVTIDFNGKSTIILGKNAKGKSSLLKAIPYALFGKVEGETKDTLKRRTESKISSYVELFFTVNEVKYHIKRFLTNADCWIKKLEGDEWKEICSSQTDVTQYVIKNILYFDETLFSNIVFGQQGKLTSFIDMRDAARVDEFDRIIGIGKKYNKILDAIKSVKSKFPVTIDVPVVRSQIKELSEKLAEESMRLKEQEIELKNIAPKLSELKTKKSDALKIKTDKLNLQTYQHEQEVLTEKIKSVEFDRAEVEKKKQEREKLRGKVKDIKERKASLEELQDKINYLLNKDIKSELQKKEAELSAANDEKSKQIKAEAEIKNNISSMKRMLDEYTTKKTNAEKYISNLNNHEKALPEKKNKLKEAEAEVKKLSDEVAMLREKKSALLQLIDLFSKINISSCQCPVCESSITQDKVNELNSKKGKYESDLEALKSEGNSKLSKFNEAQDLENSLKNEISKLEAEINSIRNENYSDKLKSYEIEINNISMELPAMESRLSKFDLSSITNKINSLMNEISELKRKIISRSKDTEYSDVELSGINISEKESVDKKVIDVNEEMSGIVAIGKKLSEDIDSFKDEDEISLQKKLNEISEKISAIKLPKDAETIEDKISELDVEIGTLNGIFQNSDTAIQSIKRMISNMEADKKKYEEDVAKNEKNAEILNFIDTKLVSSFSRTGLPFQIRNAVTDNINSVINEQLSIFAYDDFAEKDVSFDSETMAISGIDIASGGQKIATAIASILSFNEVLLNRIGLLILDEPTLFLDDDRKDFLKDILEELIKKANMQLIMVTHDHTFKHIVGANILTIGDEDKEEV